MITLAEFVAQMILNHVLIKMRDESRDATSKSKYDGEATETLAKQQKTEGKVPDFRQSKSDYDELRRQCPNLFDDIGVDFSEFDD